MIVDVYKIFTEDSFGKVQSFNFFVEKNSCQNRVTDLALSWLSTSGQLASMEKPNFRYSYSELASDEIRIEVNQRGFAIQCSSKETADVSPGVLEMDSASAFS